MHDDVSLRFFHTQELNGFECAVRVGNLVGYRIDGVLGYRIFETRVSVLRIFGQVFIAQTFKRFFSFRVCIGPDIAFGTSASR